MSNGIYRKGAVAVLAAGVLTLAAWKAPQASSYLSAASAPAVSVAAPGVPAAVTNSSYASIVERVVPAVVTIRVEKRAQMEPTEQQQIPDELRRFFGQQAPRGQQMPRGRRAPGGPVERGLGSGVIVTPDGYILTNNHVVDGIDKAEVELPDSRTFSAKIVGTDPASDLAVVKIDASSLPTLTIGDSDVVKVGDQVLAVGNPLAIGETVTAGIISAKGRHTPDGSDGYQDFLQTDAAINHGNSGGALVNMAGQLIGINSQILSPSDGNIGLGFAIPSNMAKNVMEQLVKNGVVHRAKLGVTIQNVTPDLASSMGLPAGQHGAVVSSVEEGGPAARAGFKQGDVITQYNGKAIADNNQLRNEVAGTTPGTTVAVQVLRNGRTETLNPTVGQLSPANGRASSESGQNSQGGKYGMSVQPLTPDLADQVGVPRSTQGVLVAGVDPDGIAADSGIQEGDVIEKVNGKVVTAVDALKSALESNNGKPSLLLVHRKDSTIFLTLKAK